MTSLAQPITATPRTAPETLPQLPVEPGIHHPTRDAHPLADPTDGFEDDGGYPYNESEDVDDQPWEADHQANLARDAGSALDLPGEGNYRDGVDRSYYGDESSAQDMDFKSTLDLGRRNSPVHADYWLNYNDEILRQHSRNIDDDKIQNIRRFPRALSVKQRYCLAFAIATAYTRQLRMAGIGATAKGIMNVLSRKTVEVKATDTTPLRIWSEDDALGFLKTGKDVGFWYGHGSWWVTVGNRLVNQEAHAHGPHPFRGANPVPREKVEEHILQSLAHVLHDLLQLAYIAHTGNLP